MRAHPIRGLIPGAALVALLAGCGSSSSSTSSSTSATASPSVSSTTTASASGSPRDQFNAELQNSDGFSATQSACISKYVVQQLGNANFEQMWNNRGNGSSAEQKLTNQATEADVRGRAKCAPNGPGH